MIYVATKSQRESGRLVAHREEKTLDRCVQKLEYFSATNCSGSGFRVTIPTDAIPTEAKIFDFNPNPNPNPKL